MYKLVTNNFNQTEQLGIKIGQLLNSSDVVCLTGDLGVGKTTFVKGLAKGLDIYEHLTSPTFTIVNEYSGKHKLCHFDVYRINNPDELYEIGFDEYVYGEAICVIEWAELVSAILPKEKLWVKINKDLEKGVNYREILIECYGEKYSNFIEKLTKVME